MLHSVEYYLRDCPDLNVFSDSEIAEIAAIIENQNQHIVRIDVEPATLPIFYTDTNKESQKREYFYIRTGNQNHPILFPRDIIHYIQKRFKFNIQP